MNKEVLWKSDMGNGMFRNPILYIDYSDPDVIRVNDKYYMTASSFNYTPGLPILESEDLVNWKLVQYAVNRIENPVYEMPQHSKGVWAPAIRYHEGWFYIYYGMPDEGIFMVRTTDPCGEWESPVLVLEGKGLIDPCPIWDEDGKAYIVHGYAKSRIGFNSYLGIFEISIDGKNAVSEDHLIFNGSRTQVTIEGPKIYKREGFYYIFAPAGGVVVGWQTVLRSKNIYGPYEEKIVMRQGNTPINGPHQGALVDTPYGEEWFIHFQDRGAYGRVTHLQPVVWENGWPIIGKKVEGRDWGEPYLFYKKPTLPQKEIIYSQASDEFDKEELELQWQWTGNYKKSFYSLTDRKGWLRLYSQNPSQKEPVVLWNCANILTQKIVTPQFTAETELDLSHLGEKEQAGLIIMGGQYAWLGVRIRNGERNLVFARSFDQGQEKQEEIVQKFPLLETCSSLKLRVKIEEKENVRAYFSFSIDGEIFEEITTAFIMSSHTWVGSRTGLFSVALNLEKEHGYADFSYIHYKVDSENIPLEFQPALAGDLEAISYMAEYTKTNMNLKDSKYRSFLHYAAQSGNQELIRYLTEKIGLSLMEGDGDGITPLELAKDERTLSMMEALCGVKRSDTYKNPIRMGMYPDPSIVRVGNDYYMVNSSFVYFPCIPISHSTDLIHWNIIGHAIIQEEWAELAGVRGGFAYWAPDISYYDGTFYITATYRRNDDCAILRKQMIVSSNKPEGPYSKPVWIEEDGIDPSLFHEDGRHYMILNRGARILELNAGLTAPISKAKMLYYGDCKIAPEGPHLLKKDGYYYLFLAEGGTGMGHRITVARSKTLDGSYEPCPYNPIMRQTNPNGAIQRSGHGKPVQTQNGEWYMIYLCARMTEQTYTLTGRETAMDPITWTPDGWPIVNGLKGPSVLQKRPNLPNSSEKVEMEECFKNGSLSKEWVSPRGGCKKAIHFGENGLKLDGDSFDLNTLEARNILLRRQTAIHCVAKTSMTEINLMSGQDAGMTCYYDENSWLKFGIFRMDHDYRICLVEQIGTDQKREELFVLPELPNHITWTIKVEKLRRIFLYQSDTRGEQVLAVRERLTYLCDEGLQIGKRFTGPMIGIYVFGKGGHAVYSAFSLQDKSAL